MKRTLRSGGSWLRHRTQERGPGPTMGAAFVRRVAAGPCTAELAQSSQQPLQGDPPRRALPGRLRPGGLGCPTCGGRDG